MEKIRPDYESYQDLNLECLPPAKLQLIFQIMTRIFDCISIGENAISKFSMLLIFLTLWLDKDLTKTSYAVAGIVVITLVTLLLNCFKKSNSI